MNRVKTFFYFSGAKPHAADDPRHKDRGAAGAGGKSAKPDAKARASARPGAGPKARASARPGAKEGRHKEDKFFHVDGYSTSEAEFDSDENQNGFDSEYFSDIDSDDTEVLVLYGGKPKRDAAKAAKKAEMKKEQTLEYVGDYLDLGDGGNENVQKAFDGSHRHTPDDSNFNTPEDRGATGRSSAPARPTIG